jgi:hypothetical protein
VVGVIVPLHGGETGWLSEGEDMTVIIPNTLQRQRLRSSEWKALNQLVLRIRPEVPVRRHRAGFRHCWRWKSIETPKLERFQQTDSAGCEALPALFLGALGQ